MDWNPLASFGGALVASGIGVAFGARFRKLDAAERRAEQAEQARAKAEADEREREMRLQALEIAQKRMLEDVDAMRGER